MALSMGIEGKERTNHGTRQSRKLRALGLVPAVIYGHKEPNLNLSLTKDEINRIIRQGTRVVDLKTASKTEKALIRFVQWDHLGQDILHVDFARVSEDERIVLDVRVELRGIAPGVAVGGGALVQPIHSLHVECSVLAVPDSIRVNISELQMDQAIHVKDLQLPAGVVVKNDPDAIIVQISQSDEEEPAAVPEAVAEPELIGRAAKDKEEAAE